MGWFDGDSSSEDEKKSTTTTTQRSTAADATANSDDCDDDPLDAYMKSLTNASSSNSNNNNNVAADRTEALQTRLDWDNEEEATEHWSDTKVEPPVVNDNNNNSNRFDTDDYFASKQRADREEKAQKVRQQYFHEAGESMVNNDHSVGNDYQIGGTYNDNFKQRDRNTSTATSGSSVERTADFNIDFPIVKQIWQPHSTAAGTAWRKENNVHCSSNNSSNTANAKSITSVVADPVFDFAELREVLGQPVLDSIQKLGHQQPTLVQSQAVPVILSGRDALVTAATGQGKTLTYLWPLVAHVIAQPNHGSTNIRHTRALVLVPTRELAVQVNQQAKPLCAALNLFSKAVIGGQGAYLLRQEMKKQGGLDLAIATPGRLMDVTDSKKGLSLSHVSFVVLDEADKMLDMGFVTQVRSILHNIRPDRQTIMLSATLGKKVEAVAREWQSSNVVRIAVGRTGQASEHVQQYVMVLPNEAAKQTWLAEMLPTLQAVGRTLVFVATKLGCEDLAKMMRERMPTVPVHTLHGDKHQWDRTAALREFKQHRETLSPVLVATDVAARGLDIPSVASVVNYDPAKNLDSHVHRVGRAGRLSRGKQGSGIAYTLLTNKQADFAFVLQQALIREGQDVSLELQNLAQSSHKAGYATSNIRGQKMWNKAGLGYAP